MSCWKFNWPIVYTIWLHHQNTPRRLQWTLFQFRVTVINADSSRECKQTHVVHTLPTSDIKGVKPSQLHDLEICKRHFIFYDEQQQSRVERSGMKSSSIIHNCVNTEHVPHVFISTFGVAFTRCETDTAAGFDLIFTLRCHARAWRGLFTNWRCFHFHWMNLLNYQEDEIEIYENCLKLYNFVNGEHH